MMDTFKELGLAGAIQKLYGSSPFKACDNPFFECGDGFVTSAAYTMLEGIDFDLTYFPFKYLGYKAVVGPTGELYAVMSSPKVLNVSLGVSAKLDFPEVEQIWSGIVEAAKQFGYQNVALSLRPSLTGLSISVSATGYEEKSFASKRPIAKSMDLICLSNNAGAAFLGEQILRLGKGMAEEERKKKLEQYRQIVGAYLKPELSPATLDALKDSGIFPSFGYFCRDGLAGVVKKLCAASGLGAKIYVDKLPLAGGSVDAAALLGTDPLQAALKGGDDYCLLYTVPIGSHERFRRDFQAWDVIGHLAQPSVGAVLVSPDGLEHNL